jgi:hypothetical protein
MSMRSGSGSIAVSWDWSRCDEDDNETIVALTLTAAVDFEAGDRDCPGGFDIEILSAVDEKGEDYTSEVADDDSAHRAIMDACSHSEDRGYDDRDD